MQPAEMCQAIYSEPEFMKNERRWWTKDLCVAYGEIDGENWLVFRGTVSPGGWLLNVEARLVQHSMFPGRVHQGFLSGFLQTFSWIYDLHPDHITGHSLGGALATLASHYFEKDCVTFGCPRVGDLAFATGYKQKQIRYVNDRDPVPLVPLIPFKHVCEPTKLGRGWWQWVTLPFRDAVEDHFMENYIKALNG